MADAASPAGTEVPEDVIPSGALPPLQYRDMPEPPKLKKLIGPGIILAGLSLGSGEFILWPYITYKAQFVFFWACLLGVMTQFILNMEIGRWTLATGETAIGGFIRMGKPWAVVFLIANLVPHMLPAWASGAGRTLSWLVQMPSLETVDGVTRIAEGSEASNLIVGFTIGTLFLCGIVLTAGPVIYNTVEKIQMILVTVIILMVLVIAVMVVRWDAIEAQISGTLTMGHGQLVPDLEGTGLSTITLLGALAFAGCGGTLNLGQSNYFKDKGFGMGAHIGRITSPITGQEEAIAETGYHFPHTEENMRKWNKWWSLANREHFLSFFCTCAFCLIVLTLISYSLFYVGGALREGAPAFDDSDRFSFIFGESVQLSAKIKTGGQMLFLLMGFAILLTTEFGVLDVVSRIATDTVKIAWLRDSAFWTEGRLYYAFLWGEILIASAITLIGEDFIKERTLGLFEWVAAINGAIMCIYSATLLWLNNRYLPKPLRMSKVRFAAMIWSFCFFGVFAVWASVDTIQKLFGSS